MMNLPPNIRLIDSSLPGSVIGAAPINGYTALQIPAYWRAMNFLGNVATFKRTVRKRDDSCGGTDVPHPLDELLMLQPNECQDAATFWSTLFFHLNHYGNGLAQIIRDPLTQAPIALQNLLPEFTCPFRFDADDGRGFQQYYDVGTPTPLRAADVIHLADPALDTAATGKVTQRVAVPTGSARDLDLLDTEADRRVIQHLVLSPGSIDACPSPY